MLAFTAIEPVVAVGAVETVSTPVALIGLEMVMLLAGVAVPVRVNVEPLEVPETYILELESVTLTIPWVLALRFAAFIANPAEPLILPVKLLRLTVLPRTNAPLLVKIEPLPVSLNEMVLSLAKVTPLAKL